MEQWIEQIIEQYGYFGVLFLIFIENIFPPIPSELILVFGGFFTTTTTLSPIWMILAATIGAVIGAIVLYSIGLFFDEARLESWVERYGKRIYLKAEDVRKADQWFDRFGPKLIFFGRFVPVVRSLISIPAGMSNMPFLKFLTLTTLGTAIWNTVLIYIGVYVGANWQTWLLRIESYSHVMYVVLALIALGSIIAFIRLVWMRRKTTH